MNTSNPKFWAIIGFVFGILIAAGGSITTPLDAILGGFIQAAIWFGVSSFIIKRKAKNNE
jgi:threonine/homoserine/homoserine lactone efflux protein